ncbi:xylulokinase [Candidatus Enterococcus murrayae]|uniref:Xylulose kinase n=1 Tax=Candidatus Enterococcus murrayae TaxID=2815321 RepID=A0ABS3HPQ8_9ENTE|nr:xylulokinase [Enterococcus sp. MJM16]MBO0454875.1 xylulokinase [Enterococcus sp. MJM16]
MTYVLGLDLGTSALKGLVVDKNGQVVAEASHSYPMDTPEIGYSEQNPLSWIEAADQVIEDLVSKLPELTDSLEGISFSGQMHSLVLLDEKHEPLRPAILWNDVRTTKQCKKINETMGDTILKREKNIALEGFTLPKILWVQENEPEIWKEVKQIQLPKDYLRFWFTDNFAMDYSDAAGTLMLNQDNKTWDTELLEAWAVPASILPPLVESSTVVGVMKPELKERFGFSRDIKIIAGGADNACAALGSGVVKAGTGLCSIGTSGVFLKYEDKVDRDYQGKLHVFYHGMENTAYSMGVTLSAGNSLNWFKNTFAKNQPFEELLSEIDTVPIGCDGLLFSPYIVGERTPYTDSQIRGSFIGIDTHHQLKDFTRSVLEGITFSLKDSQRIIEAVADEKIEKLVSVGGGAKNKSWLQMQANIFDTPIVTLKTEQGPGLGAAMLAAVGCQWFSDLRECADQFVAYKEAVQPQPQQVERYKKVYARYRKIYSATKELCHQYFSQIEN